MKGDTLFRGDYTICVDFSMGRGEIEAQYEQIMISFINLCEAVLNFVCVDISVYSHQILSTLKFTTFSYFGQSQCFLLGKYEKIFTNHILQRFNYL